MAGPEILSPEKLVGRAEEMCIVREAISTTLDGRGSVLLFAGEPGIGKSTLARAAAELAGARGIPVY